MAKVSFTIVGLKTLTGETYTVGQAVEEGGLVVSSITYNRPDCPYNKGFQMTGASYAVRFDEQDDLRILVPQSAIATVAVVRKSINNDLEAVGLQE